MEPRRKRVARNRARRIKQENGAEGDITVPALSLPNVAQLIEYGQITRRVRRHR